MSQLPLEYGSLQLANAANVAQIALANAQAKATGQTGQFISTPFGEYDTVSQQFVSGNGNSNTKGMVYQNGQWYLNV
jgi:glycerol kinase